MSYQQQSTRERFTIEQKYLICDYKEKSPSLNQEQLGVWAQKEFKLSHPVKQRTISNLLSSKDKIYKSFASGNANAKSTKATKVPQLDDDVLKYIQDMNAKSIPINRAAVAAYAKIVAIRKYEMDKLPKKTRSTSQTDG